MAAKNPATTAPALAAALGLIRAGGADVGAARERVRRLRVAKLLAWLGVPVVAWLIPFFLGHTFVPHLPHLDPVYVAPILFFALMAVVLIVSVVAPGRSPHLTFTPEQIDVRLEDVRGIDPIKQDVVRSLNLFLAHKTFATEMGGTPRRGLLFEGAPGTGKTYLAKAMAREAGVPFLFVSATSFQSMFYGATAKKIRSYFKELRKTARREGGAIGFIEEIDAIGMRRSGVGFQAAPAGLAPSVDGGDLAGIGRRFGLDSPGYPGGAVRNSFMSDATGGVVNELLIQMQSFDDPTTRDKVVGKLVDGVNRLLSSKRQIKRRRMRPANILLIAATNRADGLDPALLRPGRFDRRLTFELPTKAARRDLIDYILLRKAHDADMAGEERRDALASVTQGYSPVMIEHLLDEALVSALSRGATSMSWADVSQARLIEEVGMGQPVAYTDHERRLIATHEAGHATIAHLVAPTRRLEILSIVKRRDALGMLAHGDREDVYTRSRGELLALMQIAFGGQVAEELFFGDVSTGPAGDLAYATNVAAEMVGSSGMAGSLISFRAVQTGGFGDTNLVGRVLGDREGRALVEKILAEQKAVVVSLMTQHRHLVEALRDALLEREELIGEEILDVIEQVQRPDVIDLREPQWAVGLND